MTEEEKLAAILREAYVLTQGAEELDGFLEQLEHGPVRTSSLAGLFAPTGLLQELAIASGRGNDFLELADRFDAIRMVARATWTCSVCARPAGSIELHEDGALRRESFTGVLTQTVDDPESFGVLWDAIVAGDHGLVHDRDFELAPAWCPACGAAYCAGHWQRWDVFDPDEPGFHDGIRGRCPSGHERLLED